MIARRGRVGIGLLIGTVVLAIAAVCAMLYGPTIIRRFVQPQDGIKINVNLAGASRTPRLIQRDDGGFEYFVQRTNGETERLSSDEFTRRVHEEHTNRPWWARVFTISTPFGLVWVAIGLAGQMVFTGRMIVQWLVSERRKESVVPVIFWWMSLTGASMLLSYFFWRRDIVGILGQGTGWLIYIRNLWLIYHRHQEDVIEGDPSGKPMSVLEPEAK